MLKTFFSGVPWEPAALPESSAGQELSCTPVLCNSRYGADDLLPIALFTTPAGIPSSCFFLTSDPQCCAHPLEAPGILSPGPAALPRYVDFQQPGSRGNGLDNCSICSLFRQIGAWKIFAFLCLWGLFWGFSFVKQVFLESSDQPYSVHLLPAHPWGAASWGCLWTPCITLAVLLFCLPIFFLPRLSRWDHQSCAQCCGFRFGH